MNSRLDRLITRVVQRGRLEVTWSDGSVSQYGDGGGHTASILFREPSAEASGRAPAPPAIEAGQGRRRQGARHGRQVI